MRARDDRAPDREPRDARFNGRSRAFDRERRLLVRWRNAAQCHPDDCVVCIDSRHADIAVHRVGRRIVVMQRRAVVMPRTRGIGGVDMQMYCAGVQRQQRRAQNKRDHGT